ncbi:hypothetical protein ANCCAN_21815 [Ancylostoma caninum]|uniref:ADP-ribosylation factor family protein n=1 Tax=Ancylostoma caninum TaxID=29170 RepID=A0A368FNK6_ANCCA|nr:hypothetical protein ANCCAN_21815 [Ancylostoma caninum]
MLAQERLLACREELRSLLGEERLSGATLLVLANKQDLPSAARVADIAKVVPKDKNEVILDPAQS